MRYLEDTYYPLLWAFDRLGERLFGDTWDGKEHCRPPIESPEEITAKRASLEAQIAENNRKIGELRTEIRRSLNAEEINQFEAEIQAQFNQRTKPTSELIQLPVADNVRQQDYDAYQRKFTTEQKLLHGLKSKELTASFIGGGDIPNDLWPNRRKDFCYYLTESLGVISARYSSVRRAMIVIQQTVFDEWLQGIPPLVSSHKSPSPEDLCRAKLRRDAKKKNLLRKADYRRAALVEFPGLSHRAFDRIWNDEAPEKWKNPGRPRTTQ